MICHKYKIAHNIKVCVGVGWGGGGGCLCNRIFTNKIAQVLSPTSCHEKSHNYLNGVHLCAIIVFRALNLNTPVPGSLFPGVCKRTYLNTQCHEDQGANQVWGKVLENILQRTTKFIIQ